jgi:phage regulator Rha-like protein
MNSIVPEERIENMIYLIRGRKVMLDVHLARLYKVSTKRLNEQVKRNKRRFPFDFMFQLTEKEAENMRSQFATSNRGGRRYCPFVFTEQGIAMLSSVLNSERAVDVNIAIIRTFVEMRRILSGQRQIAVKLKELERRTDKNDSDIQVVFEAIRRMLSIEEKPKKRIGFVVDR